jgi:iron complex transport system ATP-binding protein
MSSAERLQPLLCVRDAAASLAGRRIGPFNLNVHAGERVAVLGPSGAGKSTLLRLASGERTASQGQVLLAGRPLVCWPATELAQRRAVLPQSHGVAFAMSVELVVGLGRCAVEPDPQRDAIVSEALDCACASHLAGRRVDTLSGGELARVQLARVLAQAWKLPDALLLVDEPLAALDPGLQFELLDVLVAFSQARGAALVCVLHDINLALRGFERLWLLDDGALMADLKANRDALPELERLFGIRLRSVVSDEGHLAVVASRALRQGMAA